MGTFTGLVSEVSHTNVVEEEDRGEPCCGKLAVGGEDIGLIELAGVR